MIKLRFTTLDGVKKTKTFKTLKGARKATWDWVGKDADLGGYYAVSADGVVIVTIECGCTLAELFSDKEPGKPGKEFWHVVQWVNVEQDGTRFRSVKNLTKPKRMRWQCSMSCRTSATTALASKAGASMPAAIRSGSSRRSRHQPQSATRRFRSNA